MKCVNLKEQNIVQDKQNIVNIVQKNKNKTLNFETIIRLVVFNLFWLSLMFLA